MTKQLMVLPNGMRVVVESGPVETDWGPETSVTIRSEAGEVLARRSEAATVEMIVSWWFDEHDEWVAEAEARRQTQGWAPAAVKAKPPVCEVEQLYLVLGGEG